LLQQYIAKYPRGGYAADAHYWLGELYAVAGNSAGAIKQFHVVIKRFPDSARVVDALLKMGVIEESETNYTQAKVWFARVVNQFPNTMASRMANRSLTQLEQAGY
jgi:tol-pal system protein YbgF